jgi:hypothetical protein
MTRAFVYKIVQPFLPKKNIKEKLFKLINKSFKNYVSNSQKKKKSSQTLQS